MGACGWVVFFAFASAWAAVTASDGLAGRGYAAVGREEDRRFTAMLMRMRRGLNPSLCVMRGRAGDVWVVGCGFVGGLSAGWCLGGVGAGIVLLTITSFFVASYARGRSRSLGGIVGGRSRALANSFRLSSRPRVVGFKKGAVAFRAVGGIRNANNGAETVSPPGIPSRGPNLSLVKPCCSSTAPFRAGAGGRGFIVGNVTNVTTKICFNSM